MEYRPATNFRIFSHTITPGTTRGAAGWDPHSDGPGCHNAPACKEEWTLSTGHNAETHVPPAFIPVEQVHWLRVWIGCIPERDKANRALRVVAVEIRNIDVHLQHARKCGDLDVVCALRAARRSPM